MATLVDPTIPFRAVHASRGKAIRAEPVSTLYEQGKVHHVGTFSELEDQLASFASDFDRARAGYSPDRLDALVWAVSELSVKVQPAPVVFGIYGTPDHYVAQARQPATWSPPCTIHLPEPHISSDGITSGTTWRH